MQERGKGSYVIFRLAYDVMALVVKILLILLVMFCIAKCCQRSYLFCYELFGSVSMEGEPGEEKVFQVEKSDTIYQVSKRLQEERLVKNAYSFYARMRLMEKSETKLRPGRYILNTSMNYEEIIDKLTMNE